MSIPPKTPSKEGTTHLWERAGGDGQDHDFPRRLRRHLLRLALPPSLHGWGAIVNVYFKNQQPIFLSEGFARTGAVLSSVTGCLVFQSGLMLRCTSACCSTAQKHINRLLVAECFAVKNLLTSYLFILLWKIFWNLEKYGIYFPNFHFFNNY